MNIFVGNLSFEAKEEDVLKVFSAFGTVVTVAIVMEKKGKKSRGFGFVEMSDETQAQAAIAALNGQEILGRPINVMASLPKAPRKLTDRDSQPQDRAVVSRRGSYRRDSRENYAASDLTYKRTGKFKEGRRTINFMKKRVDAGLPAVVPERKFKANPLRWKKKSRWTDTAAQREAKPWQKSEGSEKPWQRSEGSAKPWEKREGVAKPWQKSEGAARPWRKPEGAAKPWEKREGVSKPWRRPEGATKPWQKSEGSAKPWRKPEGAAKPWEKREGAAARPWRKSSSDRGEAPTRPPRAPSKFKR